MEEGKEIGKDIRFCMNCDWYEKTSNDLEVHINRCPKCNKWLWEVFEWAYYDKEGKLVGKEAGITDGDEVSFMGATLDDLKEVWEKAYVIMKRK